MKQIFKTIFSAIIVISLAFSLFAFSVSAASVTISGGEYAVGQEVKITVRFSGDTNLNKVEVDVEYDSDILELNGVSGADYSGGNGTIKVTDDDFSAENPSKKSSYTLNFTAIAAGNASISVTALGNGQGESRAAASANISVVASNSSSNADLASLELSEGRFSPAFSADTTNYTATVKHSTEKITISASAVDSSAKCVGDGTISLNVGDNRRVITVTAADGSKKSYTLNIKRMTEEEAETDELLVAIDGVDHYIVNDATVLIPPAGFSATTALRNDTEIATVSDAAGKYQLYWLTDVNGESGAYYTCDENGIFTQVPCISVAGKLYIVENSSLPVSPTGYFDTTYNLPSGTVNAYQSVNSELSDFYILNCYVDGQTAFYRYDTVEGTLQRAVDFYLATLPVEADTENISIIDRFMLMPTIGKIIIFIMIFAVLTIITLIVLMIVKMTRRNYDDYDMPDESMVEQSNDIYLQGIDDSINNKNSKQR